MPFTDQITDLNFSIIIFPNSVCLSQNKGCGSGSGRIQVFFFDTGSVFRKKVEYGSSLNTIINIQNPPKNELSLYFPTFRTKTVAFNVNQNSILGGAGQWPCDAKCARVRTIITLL